MVGKVADLAVGKVEQIHRLFLRWAFGMLPKSVDGTVLLMEAYRDPLIHGWLKPTLVWFDKVVARPRGDLTRECLASSLSLARGRGASFLEVLGRLDENWARRARAMEPIEVSAGLLLCKWESGWPALGWVRNVPVRQVTQSEHYKFFTHCR